MKNDPERNRLVNRTKGPLSEVEKMPLELRPGGGLLGTLDFRQFEPDTVVIHFGGSATNVDAYTFANALVSFGCRRRARRNSEICSIS